MGDVLARNNKISFAVAFWWLGKDFTPRRVFCFVFSSPSSELKATSYALHPPQLTSHWILFFLVFDWRKWSRSWESSSAKLRVKMQRGAWYLECKHLTHIFIHSLIWQGWCMQAPLHASQICSPRPLVTASASESTLYLQYASIWGNCPQSLPR